MKNSTKIILSVLVVLSLTALSCDFLFVEIFMCELTGGQWVEVDSFSIDYYCDRKGTTPDQAENIINIPQAPTMHLEDSGDQVFIGSTNLDDLWSQSFGQGLVSDDEIILVIDSQGQVFGSLDFKWEGSASQPLEWEETPDGPLHTCISEITLAITGEPSGTLSEDNNLIVIRASQTQEIRRYDCPSQDETLTGEVQWLVDTTLSGDTLSGSSSDGM